MSLRFTLIWAPIKRKYQHSNGSMKECKSILLWPCTYWNENLKTNGQTKTILSNPDTVFHRYRKKQIPPKTNSRWIEIKKYPTNHWFKSFNKIAFSLKISNVQTSTFAGNHNVFVQIGRMEKQVSVQEWKVGWPEVLHDLLTDSGLPGGGAAGHSDQAGRSSLLCKASGFNRVIASGSGLRIRISIQTGQMGHHKRKN